MRPAIAALVVFGLGCAVSPPPVQTNSLGMKLVRIPAGEFLMGSTAEEADGMLARMRKAGAGDWYLKSPPSEKPKRPVRIESPFHVAAHEVTVAQFRTFVEATGYRTDAERDGKGADGREDGRWKTKPEFNWKAMGHDRGDDLPVVNVTWNDAVAFCAWLSGREGRTYRLPTEAEWEYACRAGTSTPYPWGAEESARDEYVWSGTNSGGDARPVGTRKPNAWGLYDMCGNVYEYCSDSFAGNPNEIVVRSASWGTRGMHCRSAFRGGAGRTHRNRRDGFRVVAERE